MRQKFLDFIKNHKKITGIFIIGLIILGYYGYKTFFSTANEIRYVLAAVEKGKIVSTISGSGQVSASSQTDLKAKASGEIISVNVKEGQYVKTGTLIVQLNARDVSSSVRDAANSYESAKLALEKFKEPIDDYSRMQAENALTQAKESKQTAESNLTKSYDDGFNTIANAFLDLPSVMTGLNDILFGFTITTSQQNLDYYFNSAKLSDESTSIKYKEETYNNYQTAKTSYDKAFTDYKSSSRSSDNQTIESLITETYDTTKIIADSIKSANNFIQFYQGKFTGSSSPIALSTTHLSSLNTFTGKTNTHLINLLSIKNSIQAYKDAIVNADRTIAEKTEYLSKITGAPDPLDLRAQELTVQQRANSLSNARQKLSDYSVRAPFDGTIAKLNVKKGDDSSGVIIGTLITKQIIAEISLNEVDAAKIKVDQEATLTFDAIENLTIKGKVLSIDAIGTVAQGVVTYNVKISFDAQDERVKPGMSVSATITTASKDGTLLVPISAVKSFGNQKYVEMIDGAVAPTKKSFSKKQASSTNPSVTGQTQIPATLITDTKSTTKKTPTILPPPEQNLNATNSQFSKTTTIAQGITSKTPPRKQPVEVGLSNDTMTEILSGLKEGDSIIVKTINPSTTATTAASSQKGLFGGGGIPH